MGERLNTQDLIDLLIKHQGLEKKEAENFVKEFFVLIEEGLKKDKLVKIKGLGTFKLIDVESRESVDVNTGERIEIKGHTKISFVPDTALRDIINKPFAHFETVILNDGVQANEKENILKEEIKQEPLSEVTVVVPEAEVTKAVEEITESELPEEVEEEIIEDVEIIDAEDIVETSQEETLQKKEESSSSNTLAIVVILITLLCVGILCFTYFSDGFSSKKKPTTTAPLQETVVVSDSVAAVATDSTEQIAAVQESPKVNEVVKPKTTTKRNTGSIPFSQIPINPDSTSYEIVGTKLMHTVREGESLIRISYRYYGTKDLYPYLIMYNQSVIGDPDLVSYGTVIKIPELKKK